MAGRKAGWKGIQGIVIEIQLINSNGRYFIIDCRSLLNIITENPTNVEHDE